MWVDTTSTREDGSSHVGRGQLTETFKAYQRDGRDAHIPWFDDLDRMDAGQHFCGVEAISRRGFSGAQSLSSMPARQDKQYRQHEDVEA